MHLIKLYYSIKKLIPVFIQIFLRRLVVRTKYKRHSNIWPINRSAFKKPVSFSVWPNQKQFAFLMRHDVDTRSGYDKCMNLARLDMELGFTATFNFVPEKYSINSELLDFLVENGFEIGVHGLKHDGRLYFSYSKFKERSKKINHYLKEWNSVGFFSPSSHHKLEWLSELNIKYDSSTFDVDPFEPQPDGVGTIFPFIVKNEHRQSDFIEIPYTLPQDFTLYILLREKNNNIWKKKLDWIAEKNGMVFLNTHPDYMKFEGEKLGLKEYRIELYIDFLEYVKTKYKNRYWHVLPKQMSEFWNSIQSSGTREPVNKFE